MLHCFVFAYICIFIIGNEPENMFDCSEIFWISKFNDSLFTLQYVYHYAFLSEAITETTA